VQPADIAEGIGLSPPVREAVARAVALVRELVDELVAAVPTTAARGRTE
jgi:hypothetical protein